MKKNLFLAGALALFSFVGVSAQDWCHTIVNGLPGTDVKTTLENGTEVTNRYAETEVFSHAGTTSIRMTVLQTGSTNQIKGGGPTWNLAELKIYDGNGKEIAYTATSNADHNTSGDGTDGAGLPALNDGNLNNYWHSCWGGSAPMELHYLQFELTETVDAFKLAWWNRPNNNNNCPIIVGLTPGGKDFTEDMLFAEYGFELGEQVTTAAEIAAGGTFAFYVEGEKTFTDNNDNEVTGPGNIFVSLSGYEAGTYENAAPQTMVQLIPGSEEGQFVIYQPVYGTYYGNPDRWTDGFNGSNGWQRASNDAARLGEFEFTLRPDGEFEITTYATRQYVDGAWVDYDEPLKLWVGYRWDGKLKLATADDKALLEAGDIHSGSLHYPIDFGFAIYKATVNKELVPDKTAAQMCSEVLASKFKTANELKEKYSEYASTSEYYYKPLDDVLAEAQAALDAADLAAAFAASESFANAYAWYVVSKVDYYSPLHEELTAKYDNNKAEPPYSQEHSGCYTPQSLEYLNQIEGILGLLLEGQSNEEYPYSYSEIENYYAQIETLIELFEGSTLYFSTFPEIVADISNANFPYADYPNNAVWKKNVVLAAPISGIRLTPLSVYIGSAGGGGLYGKYPMLALGEIKLYDANGDEVALDASMVSANYTEQNEGFESTAARLVDGVIEGAGSYYHSPWSGTQPSEHVYIELNFPEAMDNFTFEVYSRDKSTTGGQVSLFPFKVAITTAGEAYDPLLFAENPYNVIVGEKVTSVDQITADGYYVIKGLLNTQPVLAYDEDGETVITKEPAGKAMFYHGTDRFHAAAAAVRAAGAYRFIPNGDGTFKVLSLGLAKYWPSTTETGYVGNKVTYEAAKAANLNIVPSTNVAEAFVMYEYQAGLTTEVAAEAAEGEEAGEPTVYNTPYVMFMDWADKLATRPVTDPQPFRDDDGEIVDGQGDNMCFNKANGEGEWEIYKVSIENPDFFYLTNMVGAFDELGLKVGTNPGEVANLGNLEGVLAAAQKVIADSAYVDAPAAAAALAAEIATVTKLEKNPMVEGIYQVVSAVAEFAETKALYATVTEEGAPTFGWKSLAQNDIQFYFAFEKGDADDLVAGGTIDEADADKVYTIRAISTYEPETAYYIGYADDKSVQIDLFADETSDYLVLNATGSAFNLQLAGKNNVFSIHANGHGGGSGQNGNIVYWDGTAGASQWYLRKVNYETSIDDSVAEGTEVVAVSYFTPAGAAVSAPVKGINIVVTVYANGVVETKKVLVK